MPGQPIRVRCTSLRMILSVPQMLGYAAVRGLPLTTHIASTSRNLIRVPHDPQEDYIVTVGIVRS
jgi:hypothetical protein